MLKFQQLSLRRGTRELLQQTTCTINPGQRVGITGANGCGKSSLFALIQGELQADSGQLTIPAKTVIAHVAQETPAVEQAALEYVIDGDKQLRQLEKKIEQAQIQNDGHELARLYHEFEAIDAYTATTRAAKLMHGLGFSTKQEQTAVKNFSGGWRMRLNLAQALMCRSDLLLLDEPTNHLDLEAILWLEEWLLNYDGTLLLISHDRDFLDRVCNHIAHIHNQSLTFYKGNYSSFEILRSQQLANQQASFEKQQNEIAHMQQFIDRFKAKASKARQAKSRIKALENMPKIQAAHIDSPFSFQFKQAKHQPDLLLSLDKVSTGYNDEIILKNIKFSLHSGDRIGLLGFNGAGKSTFIKLLAQQLPCRAGKTVSAKHLKIGYFAQHQLEQLDPDASALLHLNRLDETASEKQLRSFLGGFNFSGDMATTAIKPFSGGEKARLALALIVYQSPNLLLLDEPTNHLDLEMRQALNVGLQAYSGAMVIVSHDRHLLRSVCDRLFLVNNNSVEEFNGDLDDYHHWVNETLKQNNYDENISNNKGKVQNKKLARKNAAELRQKSQPIRQQIKKLEKQIEHLNTELDSIAKQLADNNLYEDKSRLKKLIEQQGQFKKQLEQAEDQWLQLQEQLDILEKTSAKN